MKKENISINDYIKEFDINAENIKNLKDKIEKEINEINISYDKIEKETSKSFELKHEKLLKEEEDIKDKLQTEVTKIKSELEEYLSLSNALIKNYEKINKGIEKLNKGDKNNNINLLQNLTYVSKINKSQKEMINFSQKLMKSLKLNYIEDNIKYEEYYFNGLSIPKDIQISIIKSNEISLSWNIDDFNLVNIDKNKLKYKVEIRKENEKFTNIYEGNNKNCIINKLHLNTNYEIRICSMHNNIFSAWSEIKKIKKIISKLDSIILNESKRCDEFLNKIYEWTGGKNMELLYRGTRDGMTGEEFHTRCNNKGPTICLFKNEKG